MARVTAVPTSTKFFYTTYGLVVSSELELPELSPAAGGMPDVEVVWGTLAPLGGEIERAFAVECAPERCQIAIKDVARYLITGGKIIVDRLVSAESGQFAELDGVRLFLLGSAFGALLHQRGWLPLHVSALLTPSGVWAFTGQPGAGKSTLAARVHQQKGWPIVSDDVAVLKPTDSASYLYRGPTRLKLWRNTLTLLGIDSSDLVRDLMRFDKYHLNMSEQFVNQPYPLHALVVLERADEDEEPSLDLLDGARAFQAVIATIYRPELGLQFKPPMQLLRDCTDILSRIKVYRYRRRWSLDELDTSLEPLLRKMQRRPCTAGACQLASQQF